MLEPRRAESIVRRVRRHRAVTSAARRAPISRDDAGRGRAPLALSIAPRSGRRPTMEMHRDATPPVRRALDHMRRHLADELSLDELASVAETSKFHLVTLFREHLGWPPHQYHVRLRVAEARVLLDRGIACVDAAHAVGFFDQSHFNRWFKRLCGESPGAYRADRAARGQTVAQSP
jgi:AraC-like DNA-binding protein